MAGYKLANLRIEIIRGGQAYLFDQIFSVLEIPPQGGHSSQKQILQALNVTIRNLKLCRHLLSDSHTDLAEKSLEEHLTLIKATVLSTGCTASEADLCYNYFCGGLARLWVTWITSDFATSKEKVALMIEEIILRYYAMLESGFLLRDWNNSLDHKTPSAR